MLIIKHTLETTATPTQIWQVWQDVENWNSWDHGTEFSRLDGPFQTGTSGCLKPIEGPLLKTLLTHVEPFKMFVQEAKLFLARAVMTHSMTQIAGKTQITFQTEIRGPLAFLFACLLGHSIKKKIPIEMEEMLKKAKTLE
ncbi:putative uncharacterized protein [Parachlamydia acanthamoebae UV-7]|uniref:Polyketide cyclase/dehydrase and lipid transport n=2 Tax=Parachlamydia acanthamoebae TaxID=83552 RepID=F8KZW3_PARAV|nr:SRPBCC family protein [Parachlamydia acanthamoebae]KIA77770.1 hypothetical protein DB43_FS00110 [Parachlamydia acanthamoebae]CCB86472.1 putative uncharacterized protein [Parachlamydia acanthamoebae UV-7]